MSIHTTNILIKDGMFAAFALDAEFDNAVIGRYDGRRSPECFHRRFKSTKAATEELYENVAISVDRGWEVVYVGERNYG